MKKITMLFCLVSALCCTSAFAQGPYVDNGDGTVSDLGTGLMWQQSDDGVTRNWEPALAYAENLTLAGHSDWRLPNARELETIVDDSRYKPAVDTDYFLDTKSAGYWSGSTYAGTNGAWRVSFSNGYVGANGKTALHYVRCVRSGPTGSFDSLTLSVTGSEASGDVPLTVDFSATASHGSAPYTFSWHFGDDDTQSDAQNPSHTYTHGGTYTATCTVTDNNGETRARSFTIEVQEEIFDLVIDLQAPSTTGMDRSFSCPVTSGNPPYSFSWDFGDGTVIADGAQQASHTYTAAGTYTCTVTVTDAQGYTASQSIEITTTLPEGYTDGFDDGYDNGYAEGKQFCMENPEACGLISPDNGFTQDDLDNAVAVALAACVADPESCGITVGSGGGFTQADIDNAITGCVNNPGSCGITIGSLGGFTQADINSAVSGAIAACVAEPGSCGIVVGSGGEFSQADLDAASTTAYNSGFTAGEESCFDPGSDGTPNLFQTYLTLTNASEPFTLPPESSVQTFGSNGINTVNVAMGADVSLQHFLGANIVNIQEATSAFTVVRSGAMVYLTSFAGTSIRIPATLTAQTLRFADGSVRLVINSDGEIMLGDQGVTLTESEVDADVNGADTSLGRF